MKSIFAVRLKKRRLELGLTVSQLADACDLTHGCISQYENDIRVPGYETLSMLSLVLQLTVDYLVGHSEYSMKDLLADNRMSDMLEGIPQLSEDKQELFFAFFEYMKGVDQRKRREADELHLRTEDRNTRSRT